MDGSRVISCQVCRNNSHKYKCPSCMLKYCSVTCYKIHQEKPCNCNPQETAVSGDTDNKGSSLSRQVLFPTDDTVMPETLQKLRNSKKLKELLKNPHLRDIIKEVDSYRNPKVIMERAMREPIFTEFSDVCLHIAEPPMTEERLSDSDSDS